MAKTVVIFGATGKQGGSVVDAFLGDPSFNVRAVVRDLKSTSAQALQTRGVDVVKGDLFDEASLVNAFKGASIIYGVTADIGVLLPQLLRDGVKSVITEASRLEKVEGKNLVHAVAANKDTIELFIFSGLSPAREISGGKFETIHHFDSKAEIINYLESDFPELVSRTVELQLGMFATNITRQSPLRPWKQPDGRYRVTMPNSIDTPVPFIDPNRDPAIFVKALASQPLPPSTSESRVRKFAGFARYTTHRQWIDLLNRQIAGKVYFEETSVDSWANLMSPPGLGLELAEMWKYVEEIGYFGGDKGGTTIITEVRKMNEST
ncbi:hypothetical protein LTR84_002835 [Exophiala bonariae]|uniref:NmrA-like domain-containing protein n=1 Tax=Exophiala bonariae TaxID=1690606 RepID=A0AAV9N949_9EURO|nr:hypothetical protein LTR84_002835 [Exophiala bonariae]